MTTITEMTDGQKLKEMREAQRLTQQKLADAAGVTQAAIVAYEKDERRPSDKVKICIANTLGCKVTDIWFREEA